MRALDEKEVTTDEENNVIIEDDEKLEQKITSINDLKCTNIYNNLERQKAHNKECGYIRRKIKEIKKKKEEEKRKEREKEEKSN